MMQLMLNSREINMTTAIIMFSFEAFVLLLLPSLSSVFCGDAKLIFSQPASGSSITSGLDNLLSDLAPISLIPLFEIVNVRTTNNLEKHRQKRDVMHNRIKNEIQNGTDSVRNYFENPIFDSAHDTDQHFDIIDLNRTLPPQEFDAEAEEKSSGLDSSSVSELFQLDIVQQYLKQSGKPDHNDQIIASYLACRGLFSPTNHCLERLACHYADVEHGRLRPLERDVAALIIYSLLRNAHIESSFKRRLQRAALFGYDHHSITNLATPYQLSFVSACDREFRCPKNEMP